MKRAVSNSTTSLGNQQQGQIEENQSANEPNAPKTDTTESVGIHFTYKNTQRQRTAARKGRNLGGYQTRNRAQVVNNENENVNESFEKREQQNESSKDSKNLSSRGSKNTRPPKQTRQMKLNFSTSSPKHFPSLGGSRNSSANDLKSDMSKSPANAWNGKLHLPSSVQNSPLTSSPLAKMAKPSESPVPFRRPLAPAESPLTVNSPGNLATYTRSGSKAQTKLFSKSPGSVFNTTNKSSKASDSSPSDIDLNRHQFSSASWADIMDEVDSVKSGSMSFMSMETASSLNTTFDSVDSADMDGLIQRRSKQIAYGKNTKEYQMYINTVPIEKRKRSDPVTPNKDETHSRRHWDNKVKIWKRQIKDWSAKHNGESSGAESAPGSARSSLAKILESLPVASKIDPNSPMKKTLAELGNVTPGKNRVLEAAKVVGKSPAKSPFKRPLCVANIENIAMVEDSPSKRRNMVGTTRTICTRSLVAAMNEDSLMNDDDCLTGSRNVMSSRVDESSCSTLVDESSCMSTDAGWTVTRMPMPKVQEAPSQLEMFIKTCQSSSNIDMK